VLLYTPYLLEEIEKMTTYVIKRDITWLESLQMQDKGETIVLLGADGCQSEVPAVLLLAVSPLVRRLLSNSLSSFFTPVVTIPDVTKETLNAVGDILATGTAAGIMEKSLGKVQDIFKMLGVQGSFISSRYTSIDVRNIDNEKQIRGVDDGIKMEVVIKEEEEDMASFTEDNKSGGNSNRSRLDISSCQDVNKTAVVGMCKQEYVWPVRAPWDEPNSYSTFKKIFSSETDEDLTSFPQGADQATATTIYKKLSTGRAKPGIIGGRVLVIPAPKEQPSSPTPTPSGLVSRIDQGGGIKVLAARSCIGGGGSTGKQMHYFKDGKVIGYQTSGSAPPGKVAIPRARKAAVPAMISARQKVQIVKSADGKIHVRGLLPGQQLVRMPNGKLQVFTSDQNSNRTPMNAANNLMQ